MIILMQKKLKSAPHSCVLEGDKTSFTQKINGQNILTLILIMMSNSTPLPKWKTTN